MTLALAACSSDSETKGKERAIDLPLSVGNGTGSQNGNYTAQVAGETRAPGGERCVVFDWDRPLTKDLAVRLRSASCESTERPGQMVSRELSRTVIPISQSNLTNEQGDSGQ
jgi:hypothetical protein